MPRPSSLTLLRELAQDQWGLVTRRQLVDAGIGSSALERLVSPDGALERVAWGVYQLAGSPIPDHRDLRAAWLQLAPEIPAWERTAAQGVISHRSAAALYGLGHLPADQHEFTVPHRHQSRRPDVRIHVRPVGGGEWDRVDGLPVTRPRRIATDLIQAREDPEAVAQVITETVRRSYDSPGAFASALAPQAMPYGFRRGDGLALLGWLLDLAGDPDRSRWIDEASAQERTRS
jgi:hypothetical protein